MQQANAYSVPCEFTEYNVGRFSENMFTLHIVTMDTL